MHLKGHDEEMDAKMALNRRNIDNRLHPNLNLEY